MSIFFLEIQHVFLFSFLISNAFFFPLQYLIKGAFVSPEKHIRKSFYTLPCVWPRMENLVKWKIIYVDCKITHFSHKINYTLILPSNDFQDSQRERERGREKKEHKGPKPISPQLHPTHQRERDATPPHTQTPVRGPPHSDEQRRRTRSTKPHLRPL